MGIDPEDDIDPPDGDDLAITPEHAVLYLAEERRFQRFLALSVEVSGIPVTEHVVAVVDLRSPVGRAIGESVVGATVVEHRLREAALAGVRPSFSVPYPIKEAPTVVALLGPVGVHRVMARPCGVVAVIILNEHGRPALMFLEPPQGTSWGKS